MAQVTTPKLLKQRDVQALLGVSVMTLWRLRGRSDLGFPPPLRITSNTLRWREEDVLAWAASRREAPQNGRRLA